MEKLNFENYSDAARITLRTNRYFDYFDYTLEEGVKIVLDPVEPLYVNIKSGKPDSPGIIASYGLARGRLEDDRSAEIPRDNFYPVDFFTVDLKGASKYSISQRGGLLIIDIGDRALPKPLEFTPSYVIAKRLQELEEGLFKPKKAKRRGKSLTPMKPPTIKGEYKTRQKPPISPWRKGKRPEKARFSLSAPKVGLAHLSGAEPMLINPMKVKIDRKPPAPLLKEQKDKKQNVKKDEADKIVIEQKPAPAAPEEEEENLGIAFKYFRDEVLAKAMQMPRVILPEKKNVLSLNDGLQIATYNSIPLMMSSEEIRLNQMKIDEARRALYPTATVKAVRTDGETSGVEFREETYGLQLEQPLYYGGRLKLTLRQAQINKEVAQARYDKAEAELVSLVTEKYFNLVTAQLNFQDQLQLIDECGRIRKLAEKKYKQELSTQLELLNVQSQCNQVEYQLSVAQKDFEIARLNLLQAMGLEGSAEVSADYTSDYKERTVDLNECLLLAYQNRPELHLHELLNEAGEYEVRIAKSKDDFKVDFTGFYGSSGGAYVTEDLDLADDWYMGVKMSKPIGSNTGTYSFTQNQTSPKLGQNTRTGGTSHSLEVAILDNLASVSEKQSAYVNLLKAENELVEMEKSINLEVREAYNNYQKAVFQIDNTKEKIRFREEEVKVLEMQASLNEAFLSQVLEAKVKLADEKALYHQAIASYNTALANLNKAIGLIGYFK